MLVTRILLHLWLIVAIYIFGAQVPDRRWLPKPLLKGALLSLSWPITWPGMWLLNKLIR